MTDNSRRRFIFTIPALAGLAVLTACQGVSSLLAPEDELSQQQALKRVSQTVASFLETHFVAGYSSNPDWMTEGEILTSLDSWGFGNYKYFVNGQYMIGPIKLCPFDSGSDRLRIEKMIDGSWEKIWYWPRRRETHYTPHEQVLPEPR